MNRIAVVGAIGVGKSVLAHRLGTLLHVSVYDFDELYWRRDRERLPESEWESLLRGILGERRWICDGFPLSVTAEPLELADTVIFLDLPRWTSIVSVFRREVARRLHSRNRSSNGLVCSTLCWSSGSGDSRKTIDQILFTRSPGQGHSES